jgi:hypothetical protein
MQQFDGIGAKLERAEENIHNLYFEMERFFKEGDYPVLPEDDRELLLKAIEYHKNRVIPPRFGVLTGEIIHHLRSCFDHIVWHFSTGPKQNDMPVDFPVFREEPVDKKDLARFEGKIQRITDPNARSLIKRLQPYNATNPINDPLFIIHDFDIVDKPENLFSAFERDLEFCPARWRGSWNVISGHIPNLTPPRLHVTLRVTAPCSPVYRSGILVGGKSSPSPKD